MSELKIIGHRGARGLAPENTIAALKAGLYAGADELEFDLRVTKDGVVVLHHSPFISSGDGQQLLIKRTDYAQLKEHKPDLTTFEETLDLIGGKCSMYIEVKPGVDVTPIVSELKKRFKQGLPAGDVALGSFSQRTLRQLHEALPNAPKIVIESWSGVRAAWRARQISARIISMDQHWLWSGYIRAASRHFTLYTYTLSNPAKARRWAKHGLAGVVTDYPDRFIK